MDSLVAYSDITIKAKAMECQRIKDEQFLGTVALEIVADAAQYLRVSLPYREIFDQVEDKDLYRGDIEQHLNLSQYGDFAKFYQSANIGQRYLLDLYFMHYGITILETRLRNAASHREQRRNLSMFRDFLGGHPALNLITLSQSQSTEEFIGNLKGSTYHGPSHQILQDGRVILPAYEIALDMLCFRSMWKIKDKYLSRNEQRIVTKCFGARMNMLNLQRVCHSKRPYQLESGEIHVMPIPIQFHLTRKEISRMVEAEDLDILYGLIRTGWYGKTGPVRPGESQDLDHLAHDIIDRIYQKAGRKDPYSIAVLNFYLYLKERGAKRIVTTIEKMRYGPRAG